jgi:hypothetical protein
MKLVLVVILSLTCLYAFANVPAQWSSFSGVDNPGARGTVVVDINGDGLKEAVVTAPLFESVKLLVLRQRGSEFAITSITRQTGAMLGLIQTVALSGTADGIVLSAGGNLVTWSGIPLVQIASVPAPFGFHLLQISDIDADGRLEALGLSGSGGLGNPVVLDYETGVEEWRGSDVVRFLSAGQLDSDPQQEIVLGSDSPILGKIVDGVSHSQEWSRVEGFQGWPVFGNFLDSVDDKEFAIISRFGSTKVFSGSPNFGLSTEIQTGEAISFDVKDVDNDQFEDIIVGSSQGGRIEAFSTVRNQSIFRWLHQGGDTSALAIGSLDDSPNLEIVFSAGLGSTGPDTLQVIDAATGARRFLSADETGPTTNLIVMDSGSRKELAYATHVSRNRLELVVLDANTGSELRRRNLPENNFPQTGSLQAIDLEQDGAKEIAVGFGRTIAVLDGSTLQERWRTGINETIRRLDLMKFNADTVDDIVVTSEFRFFVLNGSSGAELYRSVSFQMGQFPKVAVGQRDEDPQQEVAISNGQNVFVVDPTLGLVELSFRANQTFMDLKFDNSESCLLVLKQSDRLERRSCENGLLVSTRMLPNALNTFVDYVGTSFDDLVVAFGNQVHRVRGSEIVASSVVVGPDALIFGQLQHVSTNIAAFVAGGGAHRIDLPIESPVFTNGFE